MTNSILFNFVYVINKEFYFARITAEKVAFKKFVLLNIFFINCEKSKMARQFDFQTSSNIWSCCADFACSFMFLRLPFVLHKILISYYTRMLHTLKKKRYTRSIYIGIYIDTHTQCASTYYG